MHVSGDAGVHPGAGDVQPQAAVAVHQIEGGLGAGGKGGQIGEGGPAAGAKDFKEIIAGTLWEIGDGCVFKSGGSVDHLIEGAVPAAGIDSDGAAGLGGGPGQLGRVAGMGRGENGVFLRTEESFNLLAELAEVMLSAGVGIDDKQMLQSGSPSMNRMEGP